jgi:hypothetical protein
MTTSILRTCALLTAAAAMFSGCIIAPHDGYREGYYDRDNHRYYHDHGWHDCGDHDDHCR